MYEKQQKQQQPKLEEQSNLAAAKLCGHDAHDVPNGNTVMIPFMTNIDIDFVPFGLDNPADFMQTVIALLKRGAVIYGEDETEFCIEVVNDKKQFSCIVDEDFEQAVRHAVLAFIEEKDDG